MSDEAMNAIQPVGVCSCEQVGYSVDKKRRVKKERGVGGGGGGGGASILLPQQKAISCGNKRQMRLRVVGGW